MQRRNRGRWIATFMGPGLFVLTLFFIIPIALTVYYSFTNLALTGSAAADTHFVGLENYKRIFQDPTVSSAVMRTLLFTVSSVVGQNILGFAIAYFMQGKNSKFRRICGPIFLSAWVMPEVVGSVCAYSALTDKGTINSIIQFFGGSKVSWLYSLPMFSIIIANIWRGTAYSMMVYQAALDSVPVEVKDSAQVDGAGKMQTITHVIVPIISNTIMTNIMLTTLMTLGSFGFIWMMTAGGPGDKTTTLPILMYVKAFKNYELGYGTAISMILLAVSVVLGFIYTRLAGKEA